MEGILLVDKPKGWTSFEPMRQNPDGFFSSRGEVGKATSPAALFPSVKGVL